jgi:hypothetical protein
MPKVKVKVDRVERKRRFEARRGRTPEAAE